MVVCIDAYTVARSAGTTWLYTYSSLCQPAAAILSTTGPTAHKNTVNHINQTKAGVYGQPANQRAAEINVDLERKCTVMHHIQQPDRNICPSQPTGKTCS